MAGFPEPQLGTLCFLISSPQCPSAQCLAGALSGRPQGSARFCTDPHRAPEQRTGLWVGQSRPGSACWKSAARLPVRLGDDSIRLTSQVSAFCRLGLHQAPLARLVAYAHFSQLFHCPGTTALLQFLCRLQNGWVVLGWWLRGQSQPLQPQLQGPGTPRTLSASRSSDTACL